MDGFAPVPEALIELAANAAFGAAGPYFPGVRAAAPAEHLNDCVARLEAALRDVFGETKGVGLVECNFSLVTTPPQALQPIQCLPHFDTLDSGRYALLHYLSGTDHGGTAFYRHRATGFESLSESRYSKYQHALQQELDRFGPPPRTYVDDDNRQFERIGLIEAIPNRAILYRGITLHSGAIQAPERLSADPRQGRLTINTFFQSRP